MAPRFAAIEEEFGLLAFFFITGAVLKREIWGWMTGVRGTVSFLMCLSRMVEVIEGFMVIFFLALLDLFCISVKAWRAGCSIFT